MQPSLRFVAAAYHLRHQILVRQGFGHTAQALAVGVRLRISLHTANLPVPGFQKPLLGENHPVQPPAPHRRNQLQLHRREGFKDAMNEAGMEIIGVQSGQWEMEQGNRIAAALLSENPGLKAILAANDSMALGAVSAVKAAGLDGKVLVAGFENIAAIRLMITEGSVLATADQHGDQLAIFGIETALDILKGNAKPADKRTAVDLLTKEDSKL